VLVILVPATAYVFAVWLIGIYVSSALFIALFMRLAGKYSWIRSIVVGLGVSVSAFVMFEIWFKIPLPKGPVENLLGY
jgi:putative tricarboxylic transport membrane protein